MDFIAVYGEAGMIGVVGAMFVYLVVSLSNKSAKQQETLESLKVENKGQSETLENMEGMIIKLINRWNVSDDKLDRKFDVVFLNNVLEHLLEPVEVVKSINQNLLLKNGAIVIDVPNEYNVLQVAGQKLHNLPEWWIAPPRHLNYFSLQSLENILSETGFEVFHYESSFPLEMFLLFGENYVSDQNIGKKIHNSRVNFEMNLVKSGNSKTLFNLYHDFAKQGIGRQIRVYAKKI